MKIYERFKDNPLQRNDTVGLPFTPGWFIGEFKVTPVTVIKMSCGGGIGGAQWELYVTPIDFTQLRRVERFIEVHTIDGDDVLINVNNIVDVHKRWIHEIKYTSTNPTYGRDGDILMRYYTRENVTLTTKNQYDGRN